MISDYSVYELSKKERAVFCSIGYSCIFAGTFLFYRCVPVSALSGALVILLLPRCASELAQRRREDLNRQFRDLLYSLSSSIAAGRQMREALFEAEETLAILYPPQAPIMEELRHMNKSMKENNESDRRLLADLADRSGCEDIRSFVQVYLTCRNMGGDLEQIIAHTSNIIVQKMEINGQIQALTAQKKTEGRMISLMPFAMLLGLNLLSPAYVQVLYHGLAGRMIMTGCLGGVIFGILLMERFSDVSI